MPLPVVKDRPKLFGRNCSTASDLTGRICCLQNRSLLAILQKHGAVFLDDLGMLKGFKGKIKEPNHAVVKLGQPHMPSVRKWKERFKTW